MAISPGEDARWRTDVEAELLSFPNAPHDDIVDVLAYAVSQLTRIAHGRIKICTAPDDRRATGERAYNAQLAHVACLQAVFLRRLRSGKDRSCSAGQSLATIESRGRL